MFHDPLIQSGLPDLKFDFAGQSKKKKKLSNFIVRKEA